MTQTADFYLPGDSWLHRADTRLKLAFAGCAILALVLLRSLGSMLVGTIVFAGLHWSAGVPRARLTGVLRALLPVSVLMFVLRVIFYPVGPVVAALGPLSITQVGLAQGAALALRLLAMGLAVFAVLYTSTGQAIVAGLNRLGVPYAWALTFGLALRFIPTVRLGHDSIVRAQQARGLDLANLKGMARVRARLPILVALMVSSFRASEQLARALEARAFNAPGARRTSWIELRFRRSDGVLLVLLLLLIAAIVYGNLRFGLGAGPI